MKLSFVIPTVNQFDLLFNECIDSFVKHHGHEHEIIVVDDGSTKSQDGTEGHLPTKIQEECKKRGIIFLKNELNSGFAKTANKGIRAASGDIITVVNNDVKFIKPVARQIKKAFEADSKIGISGALLFYPDLTIQHAGMLLFGDSDFTHRSWHKNLQTAPESLVPTYMVGVTGAVFSVRKKMVDEIGAFDENYFLACEDTEFCLRAWSRGWKVFYNPEVQAIHLEGATRGKNNVEKQRKHRTWYIKEQQTLSRFHQDLKKYSLNEIRRKISIANGVSYKNLQNQVSSNAEKVLIYENKNIDNSNLQVNSPQIFIRRSGAFGDVLMTTGVIRNLKNLNPGKKIIFSTDCKDALVNNPYIDGLVSAKVDPPDNSTFINLDLVYENEPTTEIWKAYAKAAGVGEDADLSFEMSSSQVDFTSVKNKLPQLDFSKDRIAVLHMGISWVNRTWPRSSWMEVCRHLSAGGYKVITVGKSHDYRSDLYSNVINMVDRLSVQEIRELIKNSSIFVGMDSGLLHVAQTTETPIVGLFTVANPKYRIYPRKQKTLAVIPKSECRFCLHEQKPPVTFVGCKFGTNACLSDITPNVVIESIKEISKINMN